MPGLAFCQWLQDSPLSTAVRESTWGVPILAALHVLALAWFGGAVLLAGLRAEFAALRIYRKIGIAALLATGLLLFVVEPLLCYRSVAFRVKMGLLVVVALNAWAVRPAGARLSAAITITLWIAMIFAARGMAFF